MATFNRYDKTAKTTRFAATVHKDQMHLIDKGISAYPDIAEWGFQTEIGKDNGTEHYQMWFRTFRQHRLSAMFKLLPGIHISIAEDWNALRNYSKKTDTAVPGTRKHESQTKEYFSMQRALVELTNFLPDWDEYLEDNRSRISEKNYDKEQYWCLVRKVLTGRPELASTYAQPTMLTMWSQTKHVWSLEETRAIVLQPAECAQRTEEKSEEEV